MKILAVDSSATAASAAIMEDDRLLGEFFINTKLTHSQTLMPMIEALLLNTRISLSELDLFAVSAGPGSFTGVRIGVSSVKGLAMGSNKPCASVSTLEAMAQNFSHVNGIICAVMDARCQQVYNALFAAENGVLTRLTEDRALALTDLADELSVMKKTVYLVGDGAELCYNNEKFQAMGAFLAPASLRYQHASGVAQAALRLAQQNQLMTAAELMPTYLRVPQAERELKKRQASNVAGK